MRYRPHILLYVYVKGIFTSAKEETLKVQHMSRDTNKCTRFTRCAPTVYTYTGMIRTYEQLIPLLVW